jgi:hypothetical protein
MRHKVMAQGAIPALQTTESETHHLWVVLGFYHTMLHPELNRLRIFQRHRKRLWQASLSVAVNARVLALVYIAALSFWASRTFSLWLIVVHNSRLTGLLWITTKDVPKAHFRAAYTLRHDFPTTPTQQA